MGSVCLHHVDVCCAPSCYLKFVVCVHVCISCRYEWIFAMFMLYMLKSVGDRRHIVEHNF